MDRFSSSTPEDGVKTADTDPVDGLRLEQEGGAAVALKAEKRKPVMDTSLKAVEFRAGAAIKDSVRAALRATDLFKSNNMEDLYDNINADVYRGYKTMKYML
jgi:hypothetical protein